MGRPRGVDDAEFLRRLGENVRKARWLVGKTQESLASAGLSVRYLREVEQGRRNPSALQLKKIAQVLEVRVAELVDVEESGEGARLAGRLSEAEAKAPKRGRKPKGQG